MRCRLFGRRMMLRSYRAAAVTAVLSFATALPAADVNWEGDVSTNWAVAGNWTGDALPTLADTALITGGVNARVQTNVGTVDNVFVSDDGTLEIVTGGTLNTTVDVAIANGSAGNLIQSGGTLHPAGYFVLGASGPASFEKTGGSTLFGTDGVASPMLMGISADATLTMSGGELRQAEVDLSSAESVNYIGLGGGTSTIDLSDGTISFRAATFLGGDGGATGVVNQTGGVFEVRNRALRLGGNSGPAPASSGTYNISGGTLKTGTGLSIGYGSFATGVVNVSDQADVQVGGAMFLGIGDDVNPTHGEVNQTGGDIVTGVLHDPDTNPIGADILIGYGDESSGTYNLSGGSLSTPEFAILGLFGSEAGLLTVSGDDTVFQTGANGAFEIGGETELDPSDPLDGRPTFGHMVQDGGTVIVNGQFQLAAGAVSTGVYDMNGGTLEVFDTAFFSPRSRELTPGVIVGGDGTFNHNGGESSWHGAVLVGDSGQSTYNQNDGQSTFEDVAIVGFSGVGTINVTGGTMTSVIPAADGASSFVVGINEESNGSTMNVSSTSLKMSGQIRVADGDADDVSFNVSGDAQIDVATEIFVGSLVDQSEGFTYANDNHGVFNQSGGSVSVGSFLAVGLETAIEDDGESRSNGVYNMSGGVLDMHDTAIVGWGGNGDFIQTGGTVNAFNAVVIANDPGSNGNYELAGGTLELHRTAIQMGDGAATFEFTGGRLSGAEVLIIPDLTQTGGVISTGDAANFTEIEGNYNVSGDGVVEVKLGGLTQVDEYDIFQVDGVASLGGTLSVVLSNGFEPQIGDLFEVLTSLGGDLVGTFDGIDFPSNPFGVTGQLVYDTNRVLVEIVADEGGVLGDTDGDKDVDLDDLNNVRNNFGENGVGDTDGDNDVDLDDLNNVRNNFGASGSALADADLTGVGGGRFASDLDYRSRLDGVQFTRLDHSGYNPLEASLLGSEKFSGASAVPEPSTWALGLLSSLAGLVAFRRRKK